jgi:hypothetical protein
MITVIQLDGSDILEIRQWAWNDPSFGELRWLAQTLLRTFRPIKTTAPVPDEIIVSDGDRFATWSVDDEAGSDRRGRPS